MDFDSNEFSSTLWRRIGDFMSGLRLQTRQISEPGQIMELCSRLLAEHLDVERCAYASVENETVFVISGDHCRGVRSIVGRWPVADFGEECVRSMLANKPYVMDDVEADPRAGTDLSAYQATTIRSVICVPLHRGGKFTAAMAVHSTQPRKWLNEEIELVAAVVSSCWESLERARGDEQLKETSTRLSLALSAAELGDWIWDPSSDLVSLSNRAAEIFGLGARDSISWTEMQELLLADDRMKTLAVLEEALRTHGQYDAEYRVCRSDETEIWVSSKGRAHYDKMDNPVRMHGVVQDITRQKRLEERLRSHLDEIAEESRKKDEFIALLAHELRNPLAPIVTGLDLIKRLEDRASFEQITKVMEDQLAHIVHLIDDLLDVSRITKGKLSLRVEPVELAALITRTMKMAAPLLAEARVDTTVSLPDSEVIIEADPTRLTQILTNLLTNSAKFSSPGTTVSITAVLTEDTVMIEVSDEGIGIAPEFLPRVFDMFVQAESGTAKGGLGIGLPLSRSLALMHGGTLTAASEGVGKGSKFTLILPLPKQTELEATM